MNDYTSGDHRLGLLELLADHEALIHLDDAEIELLRRAVKAAEWEVGEEFEDASQELAAFQQAQCVLRDIQTLRARFPGAEAEYTERITMIGKATENKALEPELTPIQQVDAKIEALNQACREAAAAYGLAVREANRAAGTLVPRRAIDDTSTGVRTPSPAGLARVAALKEAVVEAARRAQAAGRARNAYLQSVPYRGLRPANHQQVELNAHLDAQRQRQLRADLEAIGALQAGGAR